MNKLTKLSAALGLDEIKLNQNIFGLKTPWAKLDETQLEAIETALEDSENANAEAIQGLNDQLASLQEDFTNLQTSTEEMETAVANALQINGLTALGSHAQSIDLLATKCKEYGASTNRHSFAENDGKPLEDTEDGVVNMNHSHNRTH